MRTMMQDLHASIPNSLRINRGKLGIRGLAETANSLKAAYVLIIEGWRGGIGDLKFYRVEEGGLTLIPPLLYVDGYRLRHDYRKTTKSRWRPSKMAILQPQTPEPRKLAATLSRVFNAELISEGERLGTTQVYLHVLEAPGATARLAFFSPGDKGEIGPSLTLTRVSWDVA